MEAALRAAAPTPTSSAAMRQQRRASKRELGGEPAGGGHAAGRYAMINSSMRAEATWPMRRGRSPRARAVKLLQSLPIAGGTDLIDLMRKMPQVAGAADRHLPAAAEDGGGEGGGACASARWCRIPTSPTTRGRFAQRHPLVAARYPRRRPRSSCATWPRPSPPPACTGAISSLFVAHLLGVTYEDTVSRFPATNASSAAAVGGSPGYNRDARHTRYRELHRHVPSGYAGARAPRLRRRACGGPGERHTFSLISPAALTISAAR